MSLHFIPSALLRTTCLLMLITSFQPWSNQSILTTLACSQGIDIEIDVEASKQA